MSLRPLSVLLTSTFLLSAASHALAQTPPSEPPPAASPPSEVPPPPAEPRTGEPVPAAEPPAAATPLSTTSQLNDAHPEEVEHTWPNRPLLITGSVLLVGSYGASAIVAAASDRKADDKLFIPVVGPWLDLKDRDCDVNRCSHETLNKALLIGDGALQGAGALMMLLSLAIPESKEKPWYLIGDEKLNVMPQVGTATTGLQAHGRF